MWVAETHPLGAARRLCQQEAGKEGEELRLEPGTLKWDRVVPKSTIIIFIIILILNIVYIVERDTCPCGSLSRTGRVMVRRAVGGTNVSIVFFSSCVCGEGWFSLMSKYISTRW